MADRVLLEINVDMAFNEMLKVPPGTKLWETAYMCFLHAKQKADAVQDTADFPGEKNPDGSVDDDVSPDDVSSDAMVPDKGFTSVVDGVVSSLDFLNPLVIDHCVISETFKSPEKREYYAHTKKNLVIVPKWMTPPSMHGIITVDMTAKEMFRLPKYVAAVNRGLANICASANSTDANISACANSTGARTCASTLLNLQDHAMYQRWTTILSFFTDLLLRTHTGKKSALLAQGQPLPLGVLQQHNTLAICGSCMDFKLDCMKCSKCRAAYYCSVACQKTAWKEHKLTCTNF